MFMPIPFLFLLGVVIYQRRTLILHHEMKALVKELKRLNGSDFDPRCTSQVSQLAEQIHTEYIKRNVCALFAVASLLGEISTSQF